MRLFPRIPRTSSLPAILICLLALLSGHPTLVRATETATEQTRRYFDDTRTLLPPKSTVRVNNPAGNIRVVITQRADVLISAKRHGQPDQPVANEEIILEERPGQLNVEANPPVKLALDIDIEIPTEIYLRLFSETGSLRVEGKPAGLIATASQGNIDLLLPADANAELALNSVQGFTKSDLPVKKYGAENDRIINGQLGGGGAILVANSNRGNISISRLENSKGNAPTLGRNGEKRSRIPKSRCLTGIP